MTPGQRIGLQSARALAIVVMVVAILAVVALVAPQAGRVTGQEPVIGGPCEGCDGVFDGLPEELTSHERIAPVDEPGEPLHIVGTVTRLDGSPAAGTIVYAYHTNAGGIYPRDDSARGRPGYRHGRLRGWARTDADGNYAFDTIRPGSYPDSDTPQHIHMHVIEPDRCTYYIDDIVFTDDPRLTPERRTDYQHGRGGSGVATPERDADGTWTVRRDIVLGENVPGYASCD